MKKYLLLFLILVPIFAFRPQSPVIPSSENKQNCTYSDDEILRLINLEREKVGVHPLVEDSFLSEVSLRRAEQQNGTMDRHVGFRQMIKDGVFNGRYSYVGENLAGDGYSNDTCDSPEIYVYSWMISTEGHRETMLNPRYDEIGIGYYKSVVVTIFGDIKSD